MKNNKEKYNLEIIKFIFKLKYDMDESHVDYLKLPIRIKNIVMKYLNKSRNWEISLLDYFKLKDYDLINIKGIGKKSVKKYINCINSYLKENNINPEEFYYYIGNYKIIDYCIENDLDLIDYTDACKVYYNYKNRLKKFNNKEKELSYIKKFVSEELIKYYHCFIDGKKYDDARFVKFTGHTFDRFKSDCFSV